MGTDDAAEGHSPSLSGRLNHLADCRFNPELPHEMHEGL